MGVINPLGRWTYGYRPVYPIAVQAQAGSLGRDNTCICFEHFCAFPALTCVTPHLRLRHSLLDVPEMLCSNGVPGVEEDGICCKAQCGTCGGSGCGGRPGGPVR